MINLREFIVFNLKAQNKLVEMIKHFQILIILSCFLFSAKGNLFANCWDCNDNLLEVLHNTNATNRVAFLFKVEDLSLIHI